MKFVLFVFALSVKLCLTCCQIAKGTVWVLYLVDIKWFINYIVIGSSNFPYPHQRRGSIAPWCSHGEQLDYSWQLSDFSAKMCMCSNPESVVCFIDTEHFTTIIVMISVVFNFHMLCLWNFAWNSIILTTAQLSVSCMVYIRHLWVGLLCDALC